MRIHLKTSPNNKIVPFDHLPSLVGALHKWIGINEVHDNISLYSFSWLKGGKNSEKGLSFRNGATFFISSYEEDLLKKIISGILNDPGISHGIKVMDIAIQPDPEFSHRERLFTASPILIKRKTGEKEKHYLYNDEGADQLLTETLQTKLKTAGLEDDSLQILFDRSYPLAKGKKVNYKGIGNMTSICPVIIKGKPETIAFAWNVGLGNSTGIGLGSVIESL